MTNSRRIFLSAVVLPVGFSFAQQQSPANATEKLKSYPFREAVTMLQGDVAPPLKVSERYGEGNPSTVNGKHRRLFPGKPVPMNRAAEEALTIAQEWQHADPIPIAAPNGTVQFTFGAAPPTVIVGPERQTLIFLQPGEVLKEKPILGDVTRWSTMVFQTGEGDRERTVVSVRLVKADNCATDLVLTTNRRVYQMNLQSNPKEYISRVEFTYPNDPTENWKEYEASVAKQKAEEEQKQEKHAHIATVEGPMNYDYTVKFSRHHEPPFAPKAVFDAGKQQTYLKMSSTAQNWGTPILQIAGPNGCEIVSYRPAQNDPSLWIIDRRFDRAELVDGTGKHAKRVDIYRDGFEGKMHCGKKIKHGVELATAERK